MTLELSSIPARHFTGRTGDPRDISLVVIHTTEGDLRPGAARAVANWFASPKGPQASSHYIVDCHEIISCVDEKDVAWSAPGANQQGVHIELTAWARWSKNNWESILAHAMLGRAATLVADICARRNIAIRRLNIDELRRGERGLCGHVDVGRAWKKTNHTDPGSSFPWGYFLELVRG